MAQAPKDGAVPAHVEVVGGTDGTTTRALKTDAAGELQVDVLTMPTSTPPTGASATQVQGTAANGGAAVGNPVQVAGLDGATLRAPLVKALTTGNAILATLARRTSAGVDNAASPDILTSENDTTAGLYVPVMQQQLTGSGWQRVRGVETSKPGQATALANGSTADVWTPAIGKKFRLLGLAVGASAAGRYALVEGAGNTLVLPLRLPANQSVVLQIQANGILSAAANNVLKLRNDSGGAADLDWCAWGMEE